MLIDRGNNGGLVEVKIGDMVIFTRADGIAVPAIVTRLAPPDRVALTVFAPETAPSPLGDRPYSEFTQPGHWSFRP